ncbi:hypothetical protein GCM10022289_04480 [Pedobacter jeongneungensis]|uniref:RNA polymerase sigma-70 region 2 domain-containing protein n=1 Tax=Pedobacter jeongneungensis TaxID=947309 RepID=A0ABP8B3Q5_9SPHI
MNVSVNRILDQDASLKVWLSEQEVLFGRLRVHDVAAFKMLYQKYAAAIYGSIIRQVSDEEKAKSILTQTFCEVWQSFASYDETKLRIFTWINQLAVQNIKKATV